MPRTNNNNAEENQSVHLDGVLSEFRDALNDEIAEIRRNGQSTITLREGRRIVVSSGFWYDFKIDYLPNLPADTPCQITVAGKTQKATVISYDESNIKVEVKEELPDSIPEAKLENGSDVLFQLLIKRIEDNAQKENAIGSRLLNGATGDISVIDSCDKFFDGLNENQVAAIKSGLCNNATFIWGPPGTGKTKVIVPIIQELLNRNRSVLMVSHTNIAVNEAIGRLDEKYHEAHQEEDDTSYPILRLGSGGTELNERLQLDHQVELASQELANQKKELESEEAAIEEKVNESKIKLAKIKWVQRSNIDAIDTAVREKEQSQLVVKEKQDEYNQAESELDKALKRHPEYNEIGTVKEELNSTISSIDKVSISIRELKGQKEEAKSRRQRAEDEISKHNRYIQLKDDLSKILTENVIQGYIASYERKIRANETFLKDNDAVLAKDRETVRLYNEKSRIGKFFAGKSEYEKAQESIESRTIKAAEVQKELELNRMNLKSYETQLTQRQALEQQLTDCNITLTKGYWESQVTEKFQLIKKLIDDIAQKENELSSLNSKKEKCEEKLRSLQKVLDAITPLIQIRDDRSKNLIESQKELSDKRTELDILVEQEKELCDSLFNIPDDICSNDVADLKELLNRAKIEITDADENKIKEELDGYEDRLKEIAKELSEIQKKIDEIVNIIIKNAKVIGTTLTKAYLSDEIQSRTFDTVILDEASMAAIPALWCAALVATKNVIIVGDFLQLPPIVMAETPMSKKWLGRDIFMASGVQKLFESDSLRPNYCIMLDEQYRMDKEIADIVNMYYKKYSKLKSSTNNDYRKKEREIFDGWYNYSFEQSLYSKKPKEQNVHLIDTSSLNAWVTSVPVSRNKNSRFNTFSAVLSVELAFKLLENKLKTIKEPEEKASVLIVAPYKPHVLRIKQIIKDEYIARGFPGDMNLIKVGTIHSFQGKEADIVVFDLVIDEPHYKAGLFIQDPEIDFSTQKMFNVAMTRARFKLYFVGNFNYCQKKAKNNTLADLLNYLLVKQRYPLNDAKTCFPRLTYVKPTGIKIDNLKHIMEVCKGDTYQSKIQVDIQSAHEKIVIYSPFMTEKATSQYLADLKDAINRSCKVIVITKPVDEVAKGMQTQKKKCEIILQQNDVLVLHKKGMHEKLVFIDDSIVWIGSLNMLSFGGETGEIMCKIVSKEGTKELTEMYDLQYLFEALENSEQECPICGKEVIMAESDKHGYYWHCVDKENCGWSRNPEEPYPHNGVLSCPQCGEKYKFKFDNQPRWVCPNNNRHYRQIRKGDLKLEKMWEDVSKQQKKDVEAYFADKAKETQPEKKKPPKKSSPKKQPSSKTTKKKAGKGKSNNGQLSIF